MAPKIVHSTTSEIAALFQVDDSTVRRWVRQGLLKPSMVTPGGHYRFDPEDVARLLKVAAA